MPALADHQSASVTKLLFIGDSGAGKTGALASLAKAGFNLRIFDYDNGLDILRNLLLDDPAAMARVEFETIIDERKAMQVPLLGRDNKVIGQSQRMVAQGDAWQRTLDLFKTWHGGITTWTPEDVLVIDSLTFLGRACMNFILKLNNRTVHNEYDYGHAQDLIEKDILATLYSDDVNCNVIVNAHIDYVQDAQGIQRGMPVVPGKKLTPKVGRYFNSILRAKSVGKERKILTATDGTVELKTSAPNRVKPEYPLATGLADYFRDVRAPQPASHGAIVANFNDAPAHLRP